MATFKIDKDIMKLNPFQGDVMSMFQHPDLPDLETFADFMKNRFQDVDISKKIEGKVVLLFSISH